MVPAAELLILQFPIVPRVPSTDAEYVEVAVPCATVVGPEIVGAPGGPVGWDTCGEATSVRTCACALNRVNSRPMQMKARVNTFLMNIMYATDVLRFMVILLGLFNLYVIAPGNDNYSVSPHCRPCPLY